MGDGSATLRHRPHGVLAVFGPTIFPAICLTGILCRRCWREYLVFKPSELTPHSGEAVVKLWAEPACRRGC
jgi:succinylglutamic semialdehyde dehydrogenase